MLINAQEKAQEHPETFWAPSEDELNALHPGVSVKVCVDFEEDEEGFSGERFWVIIKSVENGEITATVDNDLLHTLGHGFKCGDEITLKPEHIYDILFPVVH